MWVNTRYINTSSSTSSKFLTFLIQFAACSISEQLPLLFKSFSPLGNTQTSSKRWDKSVWVYLGVYRTNRAVLNGQVPQVSSDNCRGQLHQHAALKALTRDQMKWKITPQCHANILPSIGQQNNKTAQLKAGKFSPSHFSPFLTVVHVLFCSLKNGITQPQKFACGVLS